MNIVVAELERPVSSVDATLAKTSFNVTDETNKDSISFERNSQRMSISKVIENPGNREIFTLHVKNLQYVPAHSLFEQFEYARYLLSTYNMSWLFPCYRGKHRELKQTGSTIHCINFKAKTGELVGVLGSSVERFELMHLLAGRKKTGFFDGHISLAGGTINRSTFYYDNVAFVQKKTLYIPGLTYQQMIEHGLQLRVPNASAQFLDERVKTIVKIMKLEHCLHRKIPDYPSTRGDLGCDLRKLSIALEIVKLPLVIVIDEPTLDFEPTTSIKIIECLHALSRLGHIVICSMSKPSSQDFNVLDRAVLISEGHSIYSGPPSKLDDWFCSKAMGYKRKKFYDHVDFAIDICSGTERPESSRVAEPPAVMQEKFQLSALYDGPDFSENHSYAFSPLFFQFYGYFQGSNLTAMESLSQLATLIVRAYRTKVGDRVSMTFYFTAVLVLGPLIGYLMWGQGHSVHNYCCSVFGVPYRKTFNQASLLFFCSAIYLTMFFQDAHTFCQRVQLFRYEQRARCSNLFIFYISTVLSEVPFALFFVFCLSNVVYFMTSLGKGLENYSFYVSLCLVQGILGLTTTVLYAVLFKKEIVVRDMFFFTLILVVLFSGFPFPITVMPRYLRHFTEVLPVRWAFEAFMSWFFRKYKDGDGFLLQFGFSSFDHHKIFSILTNFIAAFNAMIVVLLFPAPQRLRRVPEGGVRDRGMSMASNHSVDSDFGQPSFVHRNSEAPIDGARGSSFRASQSIMPVILMRQSTVTGRDSRMSVNLSHIGEENLSRGPTVVLKNINYRAVDAKSPGGYRSILKGVFAQISYGKLTVVLGAPNSGKSSLVHVIAGNVGARTLLDGSITFNGKAMSSSDPLWERCGFVPIQNDHLRDLTVSEVVTYAMRLRCYNSVGLSVVEKNVETTLENLHLTEIANKKVKFLNQGECKRLSIAEELVHGPQLLVMDEPTTGVSLNEIAVMFQVFRELVNNDRTVVTTMYQPTVDMFNLFDNLILLSQGRVIYAGRANVAHDFFINSPFKFYFGNHSHNPADFLVDISGAQLSDANGDFIAAQELEEYYLKSENFQSLRARLNMLNPDDGNSESSIPLKKVAVGAHHVDVQQLSSSTEGKNGGTTNPMQGGSNGDALDGSVDMDDATLEHSSSSAAATKTKPYPIQVLALINLYEAVTKPPSLLELQSFWFKRGILLRRAAHSIIARPSLIVGNVLLHVLLALAFAWVLETPNFNCMIAYYGIGTMFLIMANIQLIFFFHNNQMVFLKEHGRGLYSNLSHFYSSSLPLYLLGAVNGVVFSSTSYGIFTRDQKVDSSSEAFGFVVLSFMVVVVTGMVFAETIIYMSDDMRSCYITVPTGAFVQFTASGLFLKAGSSPSWMRPWFPSIAVIRWMMQGCYIACYKGGNEIGNYILNTKYSVYNDIAEIYGWGGKSKWYCLGMVVINFIVFRYASLLANGYKAFLHKGTGGGTHSEQAAGAALE